ncbi:hypothetical protein AAC387_Pa08g0598 [Persea americana]
MVWKMFYVQLILNGLRLEYSPFKTSIRTRSTPITIEELHVLLLCEELNLESAQQLVSDFNSTVLIASKESDKKGSSASSFGSTSSFGNAYSGSSFGSRGRGSGKGGRNNAISYGNSQNTSNNQSVYPKPCCQIYNRTGHLALGYQGNEQVAIGIGQGLVNRDISKD